MGRHVEHRGGFVNVIAISNEVVCVAAARDDDRINLLNVDDHFERCSFCLRESVDICDFDSWSDYLDAKETVSYFSAENVIMNAIHGGL